MKFKLNPQKWTPVTLAWVEGVQPSILCKAFLHELDAARRILEVSTNDWDQASTRWIADRISNIRSYDGTESDLLRDPKLIEEVYTLACLDEELDRIESKPAWKICESIRDRAMKALLVEKGL